MRFAPESRSQLELPASAFGVRDAFPNGSLLRDDRPKWVETPAFANDADETDTLTDFPQSRVVQLVKICQAGTDSLRHVGLFPDLRKEVQIVGHGERVERDRLKDL